MLAASAHVSTIVAMLSALLIMPASAALITPTSYDSPNGYGQASSGSFNYWDRSYNGTGSTTTDGAALSGGKGDLTDGVIATQNWNLVENVAGTGPYVGWVNINPTVLFHFVGNPIISEIIIYTDDSLGFGSVSPPSAVVVDGISHAVTLPSPRTGAPFAIDLSGLGVTGDITLQFVRATSWVFVSEVQFIGATVPEPASVALLGAGLIGLLASGRRKLR